MPKFFTAKGWLTPYAMACGYKHQTDNTETGYDVVFTQVSSEVPLYRVDVYKAGTSLKFYGATTTKINVARNDYKRYVGKLRTRFEPNSEVQRNVIV